jgi:anti-sigma factor RsiW
MNQTDKCDDRTLSAYIDGELEPTTMREVDLYLEEDEDARRFVLEATRTAALLRADARRIRQEEIPERLLALLHSRRASGLHRRPSYSVLLRSAAALIIGLLGFGSGIFLQRQTVEIVPTVMAPLPAQYSDVINTALEYNLSGKARQWRAPKTSTILTVTPVKTYRDKDGTYYREYKLEIASKTDRSQINGLAYRTLQGRWKTKALFF